MLTECISCSSISCASYIRNVDGGLSNCKACLLARRIQHCCSSVMLLMGRNSQVEIQIGASNLDPVKRTPDLHRNSLRGPPSGLGSSALPSSPRGRSCSFSILFGNLRSGSSALDCVEKTSEIVPTIINYWMKTIPVNLSCGTCHIFRDVSLTR